MTPCDEYIKRIAQNLPETCSVKDLVKVGLYASPQAAKYARISHTFPEHIQLGKKIIIPKESVIAWLQKSKHGATDGTELQTAQSQTSEKIENLPPQGWMAQCL